MRIRLSRDYGGKLTKEARLSPGVYDSDDLAKYPGLVAHLLDSQQAEILPDDTPLKIDPPPFADESLAAGFLTHEQVLQAQGRPVAKNSPHVPTDATVTPKRKGRKA